MIKGLFEIKQSDLLKSFSNIKTKKLKNITMWELAEEIGAAMTTGVVAGIILGLSFGRRAQKIYKKTANTIVTIEVNDLENLKIERIGLKNENN